MNRCEPGLVPMLLFVTEEQARRLAALLAGNAAAAAGTDAIVRIFRETGGERRAPCPRWIPVHDEGRVLLVPTEEIDWVESCRNEVILHWKRRRLRLRCTTDEMESILDPARFIRIRRNAIVRADFILELTPWFKGRHVVSLRDGTKLTSARSRWNPFRGWIGEAARPIPGPTAARAL
ncbi:MAG TPA: LytTR family DNA-binding domain-containing protein [Thermoanaerobaculia bacterium]